MVIMKIINLELQDVDELLYLEEEMYWQGEKWKVLWQESAKEKFRAFIKDYLTNFPKGCFGLKSKGKILGAMFLTKISKLKPIPYLHKFQDHFEQNGKIAYVSFFIVRKGSQEERAHKK